MTDVFKNLKTRLVEIENGLGLTGIIDIDVIEQYQELTKAYLLLVHAELEKYFELLSVSILYYAFDDYKNNSVVNVPLISAASTNIFTFTKPESYDDLKHRDGLELGNRVSNTLQKFVKLAKKNNGIKAKDVFELLWTLGFSKDEVGEDLLALLDSFGAKRGSIAHTGANINKELLNINTEKSNTKRIVDELEKFDLLVESKHYLNTVDINTIESIIFTSASN